MRKSDRFLAINAREGDTVFERITNDSDIGQIDGLGIAHCDDKIVYFRGRGEFARHFEGELRLGRRPGCRRGH